MKQREKGKMKNNIEPIFFIFFLKNFRSEKGKWEEKIEEEGRGREKQKKMKTHR